MKKLFTLFLWLIPFFASAQTIDTAAVIREVDSLLNLGNQLQKEGKFQEALLHVETSLAAAGKHLGKEHLRCGWALNNLGRLYADMSLYELAELSLLGSLKIKQKRLGKEHDDCALTMTNLANLYMEMGRFESAEPLYLEAKIIWEKVWGKEHLRYGWALHNLGWLHAKTGRFESAELFYLEALKIKEKTLGKENDDYATTLSNLANAYFDMGRYESAEPLYLEAKNTFEKVWGREHFHYGWALNNLGRLYMNMGRCETAEPFLLEALKVKEKVWGLEHPDYAGSVDNLGWLYIDMGRHESAEPLLLKAKKIRSNTLGKEHPDYEVSLHNLAVLYWNMGRYEDAEPFLLEADAVQRTLLTKSSRHLSEQELSSYAHLFVKGRDQRFSFAQMKGQPDSELSAACFDNTLFYKGFLLTAASQAKHLALSDAASAKQFELLTACNRRLAAEYAKPIAERQGVEELEEKANSLEKELVRTVAGFGEALRQVTFQEVQAQLQPGEAAVEFIHYNYYTPKPTDSIFYSALVLRPGDTSPHFVTLCEAKDLEALASGTGIRRMDYVANLYQSSVERGASPLGGSEKSLYELIWSPLAPLLKGVKTVYFSPSGLLHRLNLDAIAIKEDAILADHYDLVALGSTRQLVIPSTVATAPVSATIYGGVQYEMDSTAITAANTDWDSGPTLNRGTLHFSYADSTLRGGTWRYLKWTEQEATNIQATFKEAGIPAYLRKGYSATEESFKQLGRTDPSPRILHISTHGFFFPDPAEKAGSRQLAVGSDEPIFKISDHPMIRSGLVLAGANHAWKTGKPLNPTMEDGILTAYEISQLDLGNTELIVLSACETGLGDIEGNEGVYGLQRAFKIAGAKNLIMSLWQVPDQQTQELMTLFYKKWLTEKMTIRQALHTAQQEMRAQGLEPYYWAGFVLVE